MIVRLQSLVFFKFRNATFQILDVIAELDQTIYKLLRRMKFSTFTHSQLS